MKKFQFLLFVLLTNVLIAQENNQISPNGVFDEVFDRFGNKFSLDEIRIDTGLDSNGIQKSTLLCTGGYFNLYFEAGCGMEGSSAAELARRNVLCQVFSDISAFITPANSTVRVNIWVRNIANISSSGGVLGLASGFHTVPLNAPNFKGIVDNEIWKTINSGTNSYTNVVSPLYSLGGPNASIYHGIVAFNFSNTTINWHTNLSSTTTAGLYDMYSVALHEITHALGFMSLIGANGNSKLGTGNHYYSRYDMFLRTSTNQPLITNTGSCSLYNFGFNPALNVNVLTPPAPFSCSTHIKFGGTVNQAAYTPSAFSAPSSLSHLEDMCHTPSSYPDNEYYVMSESNGSGPLFMKRYLKPEERKVLCDIGYTVGTTYGNNGNLNYFNYNSSICPGLQVAGINDGITSTGSYQYILNVGNSINISGFLANDRNTASFECLQDIYGNGTVSVTSGTNFNYTATTPGVALLRYIPVSSNGNRGNITYIYIYIMNGSCIPNNCNIVSNGGFENSAFCGALSPFYPSHTVNCWNYYSASPDLFSRNCLDQQFTVPTSFCNPSSDTWNNGANSNDKMIGLWASNQNGFNEAIQNTLSNAIQPNNSINYVLTFRARVINNFIYSQNLPTTLIFTGSQNQQWPIIGPMTSTPTQLSTLVSQIVPNNNQWNYFSIPFTNNNSFPINFLTIINAAYANPNQTGFTTYILIDDVSILPETVQPTLSTPAVLCINQTLANLSLFSSTPGGVFSGTGVVFSGGLYSFNAALAGVGTHTINYQYTNSIGCLITVSKNIQVVNSTISVTASATPLVSCVGQNIDLSATIVGAGSCIWTPGNLIGSNVSVPFTGPTLYTVSAGNASGCIATATVSVGQIPPTISVTPTAATICSLQQVGLTASGSSTYTWSPPLGLSTTTGNTVNASPSVNTIYTVTGVNNLGCIETATTSITVAPCTDCLTGTLLSGTISTSPTHSQTLRIANNITISGSNVVFSRNNVKIMPGVTITVASGATLTIEGSHFYGCEKMWQGIKVLSGGKVNVTPYLTTKTSLIEDAIVAIDFDVINTVQPNAVLTVNQAIFNKNRTAIQFNGYAFPNVASLFTIKNSLFTSREIYNAQTATWPLTSAVKVLNNSTNPFVDPYIVEANYPFSFLKAPNANTFALQGLVLKNVGTTVLGTSYTYYSATIGTAVASEYNVFDLLRVGIQAENSNFKVINTTFQFPKVITTALNTAGVPNLGTGIYVNGAVGTNYKVDVAGTAALPNKFYGLQRALHVKSYRNVQFTYNTIRSNKTEHISIPGYHNGKYGVYMDMTNYDNVLVSNNTIYNIYSGVYLGSSASGNFPLVKVIDNTFKKDLGTTIGAIASSSIYLTNMVTAINYGGTVWVNNNFIDGTYNGIILKSWKKAALQVNGNTIFLKALNTSSTIMSNGIELNACEMGTTRTQIFNNNITGFSPLIASSKAISITTSTNIDVQCNKVRNTYSGLYFSGNCNPTKTSKNDMENHRYGFTLDNGGVIGQQGTSMVPADNRWLGLATAWATPNIGNIGNFKNGCLNASLTQNSPMYVRSGATFTPNNSFPIMSGSYPYTTTGSPTTLFTSTNPNAYTLCALPQGPSEPENLAETVSALESSTNPANAPASADMGAVVLNQSYRILDANTSLLQNSTALSTFYADNATSNTAKLLNVEKAVASNNLTLATTQNAAVVPENTMEESYKLFYEALLNYQSGTFSDTDSLIVTELASGCPTVQGSAVSQSATLYNAVYQTAEVFDNYCPDWVDKSMHISNEYTANGEQVINYKIYPVPNNGSFFINGQMKVNDKVLVYSNDGKKVFEYSIQEELEIISIKTKLSSGSYIVKLVSASDKELFNGNIVILEKE